MLSIRKMREGGPGYEVIDIGDRNRITIAAVEGLKPAACILRFLKGAHLQPQEYQLAVNTMAEIDTREGGAESAG